MENKTTANIKPIETFYSDGKIKSRTYLNAKGRFHRDPKEGPTYQEWYENGQSCIQSYRVEGKIHRDPKEGPAYTRWHSNGQLDFQQYCVEGKVHRDPKEGPAHTKWEKSGEVVSQSYYVDGEKVPTPKVEEEIKEIIKPIETFYPDGKIQSRTYRNAKGNIHRDPKEGPAYEAWYDGGDVYSKHYYVDGIKVPAPKIEVEMKEEIKPIEEFYSDGKIRSRTYKNAEGNFCRDPKDGPAYERWHEDGQINLQEYYVDNKLNRDPKEGPAYTLWYQDGQIASQQYYVDNKLNRDPKEGPAYQDWYSNGQISSQRYFVKGNLHRGLKGGPAAEYWHQNGLMYYQSYYTNGKQVTKTNKDPKVKKEKMTKTAVAEIKSISSLQEKEDNSSWAMPICLVFAAIAGIRSKKLIKEKTSPKKVFEKAYR